MNRRDFLLLNVSPRTHAVTLSCEELYMRFLDSRIDNTSTELFARLGAELRAAQTVHLNDTSWFADPDFRQALSTVLESFRAAGGRVVEAGRESLSAGPPPPR
jgi:hypothetical protein